MTKWLTRVGTCALALLPLLACSDASAGGARRIAVIPKGTTHEFWKAIHAGAARASHELGVEIIWKGPLREDDRDAQVKVVEDFIVRGVDGIVIAPLDDVALARPLMEAAAEGIPVIIIDSDVDWDGRASFVATDNYKGGVIAARELGRLLDGNGRVIVTRYQEGSASTIKREKGCLETLAREFPGIEVVSDNQYAGATAESAYQTAENLLNQFAEIDGIFSSNESSAFGMLRALQDSGRAGSLRFVGFDSSAKLVQGLQEGAIDALVIQNPVAMGDLAVRKMVAHLDGALVEPRIDTGVALVTRANMDQGEMRALLFPDLTGL